MEIPHECFSTTFQRRLKQYAYRFLIGPKKFPVLSYDDDLLSLSEEVVQEAYTRVYEARKDATDRTQIQWFVFFCGVIRNIVREEARRAFRRERHQGRKVVAGAFAQGTDVASILPERLTSSANAIHQNYEDSEIERIFMEELAKFPADRFFRHFARRQLFEGESGRSIWNERHQDADSDNHLRGLATYFRWYEKLLLAVLKRWTANYGEEGKKHVER